MPDPTTTTPPAAVDAAQLRKEHTPGLVQQWNGPAALWCYSCDRWAPCDVLPLLDQLEETRALLDRVRAKLEERLEIAKHERDAARAEAARLRETMERIVEYGGQTCGEEECTDPGCLSSVTTLMRAQDALDAPRADDAR